METPNIDALARDGVVFDEAWSHCPMTLPSHVSMLTGQLPTTHGVRNNLGFRYDATKHPSISQSLRARGYATGAAVSAYVLRGETGLREAFDWYDDAIDASPGARFRDYQRSGFITEGLAKKWVDSVAGKPFFLFLHLYEPHVPYDPPEPFRSKYANAYDGEIATADAIVGDFINDLKSKRLYESAIIVLTSDHGEGLGDHGEAQHSILLYGESIRVPLIIKLPNSRFKGTRRGEPAALTDIAPTIAAITGAEFPKNDGFDLFGSMPAPRSIYAETIYPYIQLGWSNLSAIIRGNLHYIQGPRPEMYDLATDPHERADVIESHRREAAAMRAELSRFPGPTTANLTVTPEEAAKLTALGYVGSMRQRPDPRSLPNPRDVIASLDEMRVAYQLAAERRYNEAIPKMNALLTKNPRLVDVRVRLAEIYAGMGRPDDAIREYKSAIASSGVFPSELAISLGDAYLQAGKLEDAERAAQTAIAENPDRARRLLVRVAMARHDVARAATIANQLPNTGSDLLLRAEVQNMTGDAQTALQMIEAAQTLATSEGEKSLFGLDALRADILARAGRGSEAVAAYEREIAAFPQNRIAYARLAVLYFTMGNRAAADKTLERLVAANPTPSAYELAARTLEAVEDVRGARRWRSQMPRR